MLDRFTGMQVFVRVASLGGFSPAARALGISQTMVTKHIAALEHRLGSRLLHRSTRRLTLTEAGRQFLHSCEAILGDVEAAEAAAAAHVAEPRGTLRVNVPLTFGVRQIAPALAEYSALYPEVIIDLGLTDRFVDLIAEEWDLAIRIGESRDSRMVIRRLARCDMVLCAAPAYLARHGTPRSVANLASHNCLAYTLSASIAMDRWPFGKKGEMTAPISGTFRASNGAAVRAAAVAGLGIIYQPIFVVADEIRAGRLVVIALDQPTFELPGIYAVFPSRGEPPAKVRTFVEFFARRWAPDPPWQVLMEPANY
jgi:DNA-binding transcriptional LysR family regulator